MMRKTISIKGGEPVEIDLDDIALHESIAVQEATGWTIKELSKRLQDEDMVAFAGLLWLVLRFRLGHEDLAFKDLTTGVYPISLKKDIVIADVEGQEADPTSGSGAPPSP